MADSAFGSRYTRFIDLPIASATLFEVGDAVVWDDTAKLVKKVSELADTATLAGNQGAASAIFLGHAVTKGNDGDTSLKIDTGKDRHVLDLPVASGTFRFGTYIGPNENGTGDALVDQEYIAAADKGDATHIIADDSATARTVVKAIQIVNYLDR